MVTGMEENFEIFCELPQFDSVEAITTATKNGAWAMQMEDDLGTIEEGKLADVIIVDADPVAEITALNDKNRINEVIINGKRLELDGLWPEHEPIPGWKVGNWAGEILTWGKRTSSCCLQSNSAWANLSRHSPKST